MPFIHDASDVYLHGQCHIFAIALSRLAGLPLLAAVVHDDNIEQVALVHCWVTIPARHDGEAQGLAVVDAAGLGTPAWSLKHYPDGDMANVIEIDEEQLVRLGEGTSPAPDPEDFERRVAAALPLAQTVLDDEEIVTELAARRYGHVSSAAQRQTA